MKKGLLSILIFILIFASVTAEIPENYYNAAEGKTTATLKATLSDIISSGYVTKSYNYLYTIYETSDRNADGNVWDMYSTCTWQMGQKKCGTYHSICDCYNREHSIPQSWFGSRSPMVSDAFHVYPTDGKVNGMRSNYPFGETNASPISGKGLGKVGTSSFPGYTGRVFEPIDEYKGDFARTYFYFATRYEDIMRTIGGASFNNTTYPALSNWAINLFLKWHRQDPVSQKEIDRNDAIYNYQKNRNPFIDYPELAEYIWGDKMGVSWTKNATNTPYIETPVSGSTIDFGNTPYQQNNAITITLKGVNLTGNLSLSLSGKDATDFSLSTYSIEKTVVESGYQLTILCNPQSLGVLNAVLNVTGGGILPTTYPIKATSSDSFIALAATDVTATGFTANWTSSTNATDYLLDVFSYQITGSKAETILEENFSSETLPTNWSATGYYDFNTNGNIKMASGSRNCVLTTPAINLSTNTVLTVIARRYGSDADATIKIDVNGTNISTIKTEDEYKTFAISIAPTSSNSTITFTAESGKRVYLDYVKITTEGVVKTPVSVVGYPKLTGNVLSYQITDLENDSTYAYTVTPQGNDALTSEQIVVKTLKETLATSSKYYEDIIVYSANKLLYINNVEVGSKIALLDVVGRKVMEIQATNSQVSLPFRKKGIYILQFSNDNKITGLRKLILQ